LKATKGRNAVFRKLHKDGYSYAAIGRYFGLTRERVRQICNVKGLDKKKR
jgi:DNA-directed RNA polymerase sigma subunit (sigma70/sigma32)